MPGVPLPLHIFEKRYIELVTKCLRSETEFGVLYYNGQQIQRVGCTAAITQVLKSTDEGKLDIMTAGMRRFVVRQFIEEKAYPEADVDFFDDEEGAADEEISALARKGIAGLKRLAAYVDSRQDLGFLDQLDVKPLSFILASSSGFTMAERQSFLEMTSIRQRLLASTRSLKRLLSRAQTAKAVARIIAGNGHSKAL
jgi:Lon protease-like protein